MNGTAMLSDHHGALAWLLGLAATLVLASFLTPAHWWRRPTARGLAILGGGTWMFGALLLHFAVAAPAGIVQADASAQQMSTPPLPGQRYRVHRDLNVRSAAGVAAERVATVPAGDYVMPTGERHGDWWRVRYGDRGAAGWASSLWLRRERE